MKLQYVEKNAKIGMLVTISMDVVGLLDAHEYSDTVTYREVRLQISDEPGIAIGSLRAWMENHNFINVSTESLALKQAYVNEMVSGINKAVAKMEAGQVKYNHLVSIKELELAEGKYILEWKVTPAQKRDVVITHHRPLEDFAPSFPQDIEELMIFDSRTSDWNSDQGKHDLKTLAYWSRLRHYLPSSDITQADLITFYSIWLKLSHEERDTYRSFIESL